MSKPNRRLLLALFGLAFITLAQAGMLYTWIDEQGQKHLSDQPPPTKGQSYDTQRRQVKKGFGSAPSPTLFASQPSAASQALRSTTPVPPP